jgi:MFS family permease
MSTSSFAPPPERRLRRLAVFGAPLMIIALLIGAYETLLGGRLPDLRDALGVSESGIGVAMAPFSIALLLGAAVMAAVVGSIGTRRCMVLGMVLCTLPLVAIGGVLHSDASPAWKLGLFMSLWLLAGFGHGMLDPAHAATVAKQSDQPDRMLQILTLLKSVGLILAAASAWVTGSLAVPVAVYLGASGLALLVIGRRAASSAPDLSPEPKTDQVPVPKAMLVGLGALAAAAVVPLGASLVWATSVLEQLDAPVDVEGAGLAAFAVAQLTAVGLVIWLGRRIPEARLVAIAVVVAAVGTAGIAAASVAHRFTLIPGPAVLGLAIGGFLLLGGAVAPIIAVVLGVAAKVRVTRTPARTKPSTPGGALSVSWRLLLAVMPWLGPVPRAGRLLLAALAVPVMFARAHVLARMAPQPQRGDDLGAAERVGLVVTIQYFAQGAAAPVVGFLAGWIGTVAGFTLVVAGCLYVLWRGRELLRAAAATVDSSAAGR